MNAGLAREHIETVTSDRILVGPATEHLRMNVLVDFYVPEEAPPEG